MVRWYTYDETLYPFSKCPLLTNTSIVIAMHMRNRLYVYIDNDRYIDSSKCKKSLVAPPEQEPYTATVVLPVILQYHR